MMFTVSAKTQYAIRALLRLAKSSGGEMPVSELAAAEDISPKYLEGIMTSLKASGLVSSVRGKNGGFRLARDPADMTMLEIVEALEGRIKPVGCTGDAAGCGRGRDGLCSASAFWTGMKDAMEAFLQSQTLADVARP